MTKKQRKTKEVEKSIPFVSEEKTSLGQIKINHAVVASIVRLAALEVDGVCSVGGGFVDGIAEIFSKKESDRGVKVAEDEAGQYIIEIRVVLAFGVELANIAMLVQQNVSKQVSRMTMKDVASVDVIIDGVRTSGDDKIQHDKSNWTDNTNS